jgi:hypothetical protein
VQGTDCDRLLADLRTPVFGHGMLYTDGTRVHHRSQLRFLVPDDAISADGKSWVTTNVVLRGMLTPDSLFDD